MLGFESDTIPTDSAEWVDGERIKQQELLKGNIRGGVGLGYRRQVESGFGGLRFREGVPPQTPDNQFSLSATVEPEFLYFHKGKDTVSDFRVPGDTFALRGHLRLRWDAMERNLLDLSHSGFAVGVGRDAGLARALARLGHRPGGARRATGACRACSRATASSPAASPASASATG